MPTGQPPADATRPDDAPVYHHYGRPPDARDAYRCVSWMCSLLCTGGGGRVGAGPDPRQSSHACASDVLSCIRAHQDAHPGKKTRGRCAHRRQEQAHVP